MNPFENQDIHDQLRDANDQPIEVLIPDAGMMENLKVQTVLEENAERVRIISNIADEVEEAEEGWKFSDVPAVATRLTVEKVMMELTGKSWFDSHREEGYSVGQIMELLSQKAFVQFSELTVANVKACLEQDGKIIAYFPDLVWREYFGYLSALPVETLGMRTVEIEKITDDGTIVLNDLSSADGRNIQLDLDSFAWLSKDGWMLEVYK